MSTSAGPTAKEPFAEADPLPEPKKQLARYYAGSHMPSPMGGVLEPLRTRTQENGSGVVLFECTASSLRYRLDVPRATKTERAAVKKVRDEGDLPWCPRHGPARLLQRSGDRFVCPACGVLYGRV